MNFTDLKDITNDVRLYCDSNKFITLIQRVSYNSIDTDTDSSNNVELNFVIKYKVKEAEYVKNTKVSKEKYIEIYAQDINLAISIYNDIAQIEIYERENFTDEIRSSKKMNVKICELS